MTENELSNVVIGCAIKVHSALRPGLVNICNFFALFAVPSFFTTGRQVGIWRVDVQACTIGSSLSVNAVNPLNPGRRSIRFETVRLKNSRPLSPLNNVEIT